MFKILIRTVTSTANGGGVHSVVVEFDTETKADEAIDLIKLSNRSGTGTYSEAVALYR